MPPRRAKNIPADEDTPTLVTSQQLANLLSNFANTPAIPHPRQLKDMDKAWEQATPTITGSRWTGKPKEFQKDKEEKGEMQNTLKRKIETMEKVMQGLKNTMVRRTMLG
jgi:hypothetical protein